MLTCLNSYQTSFKERINSASYSRFRIRKQNLAVYMADLVLVMRQPCRLLYKLTVSLQSLGIVVFFPFLRRLSAQDLTRPLFLLSVSTAQIFLAHCRRFTDHVGSQLSSMPVFEKSERMAYRVV